MKEGRAGLDARGGREFRPARAELAEPAPAADYGSPGTTLA